MRTETIEYTVYNYDELSDDAKENVKQWYLNAMSSDMVCDFSNDVKDDLFNLFGENDLNVQYSLSYCQGDGLNIYGEIDAESIFRYISENGQQFANVSTYPKALTEDEKQAILIYAKDCPNIKIPENRPYCYCIADRIDIVDTWSYELEFGSYSDIDHDLLYKFECLVRNIFECLCRDYEKWGYEYFYEIDDETMSEICAMNDWEFLFDGTRF